MKRFTTILALIKKLDKLQRINIHRQTRKYYINYDLIDIFYDDAHICFIYGRDEMNYDGNIYRFIGEKQELHHKFLRPF